MQTDRRLQLAELLCAARRDGKQIQDLPPHLVPETEQEAYQVNGMVAELLGWDALGWKIAATTPAMCSCSGCFEMWWTIMACRSSL